MGEKHPGDNVVFDQRVKSQPEIPYILGCANNDKSDI